MEMTEPTKVPRSEQQQVGNTSTSELSHITKFNKLILNNVFFYQLTYFIIVMSICKVIRYSTLPSICATLTQSLSHEIALTGHMFNCNCLSV